jgi:hypothetical protein
MPKLTNTQKDQIAAILALACGGPENIATYEHDDWTAFVDNQAMWSYTTWWSRRSDGQIVHVMECEPTQPVDAYVEGPPLLDAEGNEEVFIVYPTIDAVRDNLLS